MWVRAGCLHSKGFKSSFTWIPENKFTSCQKCQKNEKNAKKIRNVSISNNYRRFEYLKKINANVLQLIFIQKKYFFLLLYLEILARNRTTRFANTSLGHHFNGRFAVASHIC